MKKVLYNLNEEQKKEIKKILIIQQKPFGDILLNTGYFEELRRHFPKAQIDYLIQKPFKTILEDNPHIDNLIFMKRPKRKMLAYHLENIRVAWVVRRAKYDLIIDSLRGTSSARFVVFSGAKYKLGYEYNHKKYKFYTNKRKNSIYNLRAIKGKPRYYSRWNFDLLKPLGIDEVEHNTFYHVREESIKYIKKWRNEAGLDDKKLIAFTPGTPVRAKQWDLDYYAQLGDRIQAELGYTLVLLWGPGEKEDVAYIASKMETTPVMAPPTTFNEAGAFVRELSVLICNDGGINHLAISQEVPTIAIFGPISSPYKWQATHKPIHLFLRDESFRDRSDNRFNVTPQQVFEKLTTFLKDYPQYA